MSRKPFDRLAADAIAAEKAGMSYGKWKVLHPHTPDPEEKKRFRFILKVNRFSESACVVGMNLLLQALVLAENIVMTNAGIWQQCAGIEKHIPCRCEIVCSVERKWMQKETSRFAQMPVK